jgi:hypothetical protein
MQGRGRTVARDIPEAHDLVGDSLDFLARSAGSHGHGTRMKGHVTSLNSLGSEGLERREVRGQSEGCGDHREVLGAIDRGQPKRQPCPLMRGKSAARDA